MFISSYYYGFDDSSIDYWELELTRFVLAISSLIPVTIGYGIIKIGRGSINKEIKNIESERQES